MINSLAFSSGHSPVATSYQSTSSSLEQPAFRGAASRTIVFGTRYTSRWYFDTFLLQSAQEST
jgi:hypothetical protein